MTSPAPQHPTAADLLRSLPQVEKLLCAPVATELLACHPRAEVVRALRDTLDELRTELQGLLRSDGESAGNGRSGGPAANVPGSLTALDARTGQDALLDTARQRLEHRKATHYRKVINATGVILHTGLGRAVLPRRAVEALGRTMDGYVLVEVDAQSGERNRREAFLEELLRELTGAEAATVVNNNAAATLIILAALARGGEVIISRGQLVEIGGSFRIPDVMAESGARLVEVGATNRSSIEDYRRAIGPDTAMLMKVHTSNYEIVGFACHTPLEELVALGQERGVPVLSDLGSGCFVDLSSVGLRREPLVCESVATGAELVCFSGDKLLGGPQAGIIVGRKEAVETIRRHPLFRALRVDKLTLVALEQTLRLYRDPERLKTDLPVLRMLTTPESEIKQRAEAFLRAIEDPIGGVEGIDATLLPTASQTGSGSLPTQDVPSWSVAIRSRTVSPVALAAALRAHEPPIFTRIHDDRVLVDCRTTMAGEEETILEALKKMTES